MFRVFLIILLVIGEVEVRVLPLMKADLEWIITDYVNVVELEIKQFHREHV